MSPLDEMEYAGSRKKSGQADSDYQRRGDDVGTERIVDMRSREEALQGSAIVTHRYRRDSERDGPEQVADRRRAFRARRPPATRHGPVVTRAVPAAKTVQAPVLSVGR
jgi:hypothetical protein